jgi:hypothetical protein
MSSTPYHFDCRGIEDFSDESELELILVSPSRSHTRFLFTPHPSPSPEEFNEDLSSLPRPRIDSEISLFNEESFNQTKKQITKRKKEPKPKTTTKTKVEKPRRGRPRKNNAPNTTVKLIQNKLAVSIVESNPVPRVHGRNPCYSKSIICPENTNSVIDIEQEDQPLTQFVDPYDITADVDFLKEKQQRKTYARYAILIFM